MDPISFFQYYPISHDQILLAANQGFGKVYPWIIKIPKNNQTPKYDGQNGIITSDWIYGIAKGLGPWSGSGQNICHMTTPGNTLGPCSNGYSSIQSLSEAIDNMNLFTSPSNCGWPDYICNQTANADPPSWLSNVVKNLPLDTAKLTNITFYWDLVKLADRAMVGDNYGNWWENYFSISLTDLSSSGNEVFNVKISDVIIDGEPDQVPIYLPEGLYLIGIMDNEGNYIPIIKEMPYEEYQENTPMANELSVNIYPVPHTENSYNMTLTSSADAELVIEYRVYSNQAILIYESSIVLVPEALETLWISPDAGLPTGVLYHTFIFEDNSYKTICTVKN